MEQVRNRRLDNLCESIGDERGTINAAKQNEASLEQAALQVMTRDGVTVYKHAGVELVRVPGADKLRVRLVKDTGDSEVSGRETSEVETASEVGGGPEPGV